MVENITINNKQYPARASYYVLKHFREETGRDLDGFDNLADIEPVLFYAFVAGHHATKQEMPFKREDMEFLIDENFNQIVAELPKIFKQLGKVKSETAPETAKKKKAA